MTSSKSAPSLTELHQLVLTLVDKMAYVIENMVTKDDIKDMVVRDDIKDMVVKDDIKNMATKDDIARLERRIRESNALNVKHHLAVYGDPPEHLHKSQNLLIKPVAK